MRTTTLLATAALLLAPPLAAAAADCGPKDDFLVRSDTTLAPIRPYDCATTTQTPPEFTWPPLNGENTYTLSLKHPDGKVETRTTQANWVLWDHALPAGTYTWTLEVQGALRDKTRPRSFTIAAGAVPFVVPSREALLEHARGTPRPRTFGRGGSNPLPALKGERASGWRTMLAEVENKMPAPVQPEPRSGSLESNTEETADEQKRTLAASLAWAVTHERKYGADAARRLLAQAAWNTTGTLAYKTNDMASRNVAWTLALGYDWMHDYLDAAQKKLILGAIRERTQPMYEDVMKRLGAYPYDSHANVSLNIVAAIGALMAGELPEASAWLQDALPLAVASTSPWGWQDGGFGNGTAQAFWDAGSNLPAWYVIRNAAGVDLGRKEWVRNLPRFLAYFVPPGAPGGTFGDGREMRMPEVWSRIAKALAQFSPSPLARWYAGAQGREDASRLEVLLAPRAPLGTPPLPDDAPNAAAFPSIGWAAMHSALDDPRRTSVYFKSSPYGSYNHSHADQNSFVVDSLGQRLAAGSGFYDGYQTPHWKAWYKQTRSANAITFDGGQGQGLNDRKFSGALTRFESRDGYDVVVGHAEAAYGGALKVAQRSLVYLRPNVVVVYDRLASDTPRTWEWNLHAVKPMAQASDAVVAVRNGPARMCVEMVAAPALAFSQTDRYAAAPQGHAEKEWHGVFATTAKSPQAEFIAVMRIGAECRADGRPAARAKRVGNTWQVEVEGSRVAFAGDEVTVKPGEPRRRAPVQAAARSAM